LAPGRLCLILFYKQTGLWNSTEGRATWGLILKALAAPGRSTRVSQGAAHLLFLTWRRQSWRLCEDIPGTPSKRGRSFKKWLGFADKRQWSALAQALLHDNRHPISRPPAARDMDLRSSNLRHLLGILQEGRLLSR